MDKKDFTESLNLPQTEFPMRGNLPAKEPQILTRMDEKKVYEKILARNKKNNKEFVLHDGPPYANADIHMGHALNKVLKDITIRYKLMNGFYAPYIPGFDTHGLPIEKKVQTDKKVFVSDVGIPKFREICKDYAMQAVKNQTKQFKRLGVLGDFENKRYLTLDEDFESSQIGVFWDMYKKGYIYRDLKPVYWCSDCKTALAEAEIEYKDHSTTSIYVKFKVKSGLNYDNLYALIWTTTPWTLPANQAITVNPEFMYSIVAVNDEKYIIASKLVDTVLIGLEYKVLEEIKGSDLENVICEKPLDNNLESRFILGSPRDLDVTLDAGTGLVHSAPGHGHEDYLACKRYNIEIIVPVDEKGYMTKEAGIFEGLEYTKANEEIIKYLEDNNKLFSKQDILHSYPHCWRCKKPVIYRATTQWFASVNKFRDNVLDEIKKVKWIPEWGEERLTNMVKDRVDWCISRQRVWGVPIPIFYCKKCGKELINEDIINRIKTLFSVNGSNIWFELDEKALLKDLGKCECGCTDFVKETDTMDVWFDSGTSYSSVITKKYGFDTDIADVYLEGTDQYRGWFQSSLLTSVATKNRAPYKSVVSCGFVVDKDGRKMSKSLGNGIDPIKVVDEFGADILRLWTVASDYHSDIKVSKEILLQVAETYKKIRNTIRFLLGNTNDFNYLTDYVDYDSRDEIDKYFMYKLNKLTEYVVSSYEEFDYNAVYTELHRFCTSELSNKYLDAIKDRLYTFNVNHKLRRSSQSTMYDILNVLTKLLAPIIPFTTEEIWGHIKHSNNDEYLSILFSKFPSENSKYLNEELITKWNKLYKIKDDMARDLEIARENKVIGNSLDALVKIYTNDPFIKDNLEDIKLICILSGIEAIDSDEYKFEVIKAYGDKCLRCWTYSPTVGRDFNNEHLCSKCLENM
ncbi:MAG: isoleucine--tRNA ligase [Clostridia bacterium]